MKKSVILIIILLVVANIAQLFIIFNKNKEIKSLYYTKEDEQDIIQVTNDLERNLYKYELDTKYGNYYFRAIANTSWILTYMVYNIKYSSDNDPMFRYNLALNKLFGFMINDQGKNSLMENCSQIREILNEILMAHYEKRMDDRNKSIVRLDEYITNNLTNEDFVEEGNEEENKDRIKVSTIPTPQVTSPIIR